MKLEEVQAERNKNYGSFTAHAKAVDNIMIQLRLVNREKNIRDDGTPSTSVDWPKGFETALFYMVSKMVRLATSAGHEDSALDLSSYADLWLKKIKKEK